MNSMKQILVILLCLLLRATAAAQEPQLAKPSRDTSSREVTVIIQQQQLRFAAPASAQEVRLEVFNQAGETIYDSGPVSGPELSWALRNTSGGDIPGGLYAYTLTIKEADSETPALRRGHLILESGRDRLWVTNQGAIGAEAAMSGGELTVSSGPETNVAGARFSGSVASKGPGTINLNGFGTTGRIAKFGGGDFLVNSVIAEDLNGRIGIGTETPGSALTVAGQIETTSGGIKFPNGTVQTRAFSQVIRNATLSGNGTEDAPLGVNIPALGLLSAVSHDATLAGLGTTGSPLSIANGGVTGPKIAAGQVVKSLNGLFDNVSLTAGSNITITPSGNSLNIAAPNLLGSVAHNSTLVGNGTSASPLGVALPLNLSGVAKAMLYVNSEGQIPRCYNGLTGSSTGNCGFTINKLAEGVYRINFGFQVDDRFLSVTARYGPGNRAPNNMGANFLFSGSTNVDVLTFDANGGEDTYSWPFMLIVY